MNNIVDEIIEDLFQIIPLIRKKYLRIESEDTVSTGISHRSMAIMSMLEREGSLPVSEIGKRLLISKPQMTHLIDKLIHLGIVDRLPDTSDRRIINIGLTPNGKAKLARDKEIVRGSIRKKLSCLEDKELEELSSSMRKVRDISSRLE